MAMWKVMMADKRRCLLPPTDVDEDTEYVLKDGTPIKIKDTPGGELELADGRIIMCSCSVKELEEAAAKGMRVFEPGQEVSLPPVDREMAARGRACTKKWLEEHGTT
jgi:hypothetical protein